MFTQEVLTRTITSLIGISVTFLVVQLLLRKYKKSSDTEGKISTSYGLWFGCLFIAATISLVKTIDILGEAIDNIRKINSSIVFSEVAKFASLFIGFSGAWFLIWFFISSLLLIPIVGSRNDKNEMESDNYSYFLMKGIIVIAVIVCLLPVYEILLRSFLPDVEIPFYH